jgi:hypothetical protein
MPRRCGKLCALETKADWNRPSCDEDWFRRFAQELEDFVGAIRENREPLRYRPGRGMRTSYLCGAPVCRDGQPVDHGLSLNQHGLEI